MHRIITIIYALLAISYIAATLLAPYCWAFLHKALPLFLLAALVVKMAHGSSKWLLLGAILCSASGDILLALPIEHSFILGLSAFALAHLLYATLLFFWRDWRRLKGHTLGAFTLYLLLMLALLIPAVGELRTAVLAYFALISSMFILAFAAKAQDNKLRIGALLFVVSDSVLAINAFVSSLPLQSIWVMSTYYAAQYFLVSGAIQLLRQPHAR